MLLMTSRAMGLRTWLALTDYSRSVLGSLRMTSLHRDWDLCVSAIEQEGGPIYFCSEDALEAAGGKLKQLGRDLSKVFPWKLSYALTAYNPGDIPQSNLKNAVAYEKLSKELEATKPDGTTVIASFSYFPSNPEGFEKGFFMPTSAELAGVAAESFVISIGRKYGQVGYFRYEAEETRVVQNLISIPDGRLICSSSLVQVAPPTCHPAMAHPLLHSIFHDTSKLRSVLSESLELGLEGVRELWEVGSPILDGSNLPAVRAENQVIVIEGLDATGKTTLCDKLSKTIGATLLRSPPKCISHLRSTFDAHPPLLRRAYYSLGNYIIAQEIVDAAQTGPVVVDRFWHSSAAYAIATEVGCGGSDIVPSPGHEVYRWPQDLTKPDLVVMLVISPETRQSRMDDRGGHVTREEEYLKRSSSFQERLLTCYQRMSDPQPQVVDASGTREEVLEAVLNVKARAKF